MNHYRITISYKGTNYSGWQSQKEQKTIMMTMQNSFFYTFKTSCIIHGASRTDSGVHARGQVALCKTDLFLPPHRLQKAWNTSLPLDITINDTTQVNEDFNPFCNILFKKYTYTIYKKRPDPFVAPFGWYYKYVIDEMVLQEALSYFVGTHDFLAFSTYEPGVNTERTIQELYLRSTESEIIITIIGKSFIHHMIRRMVGAAIVVSTNQKRKLTDIKRLLNTKEKEGYCFETAPACGLILEEIRYKI